MRTLITGMVLLLLAPPALAQKPPLDTVTVNGTRDTLDSVIPNFVQSTTAPGYMTGKLARWNRLVCPKTVGLAPKYAAFVSQRVRALALEVGAKVDGNPGCRPNIEITFTTNPQGLMDTTRRRRPDFLGYFHNLHQADEMAKVTLPIQAWYLTETVDNGNEWHIDQRCLPADCTYGVTGMRTNDGLQTGFHHVMIVAEPAKLADHEIGTLADYIAMVALAQISQKPSCQKLDTILNLLAPGCGRTATAMTVGDVGYLKGLYAGRADSLLVVQRNAIGFGIRKALEGER